MVATRRLLPDRLISTLFAEAYESGKRRSVNMLVLLVCRWQAAMLANPRSGIRRTAL
jgi:hypothetical protein